MGKIDTSCIPEKRSIDKDSELLQNLRDARKENKERGKMGFNAVKLGLTISGVIMGIALIMNTILVITHNVSFVMVEPLKIYLGIIAAFVIGAIGYIKGTSD
jgi:hypothetical protein